MNMGLQRAADALVFRRLVFIAAVVAVLAGTGVWLLLFRWQGENGEPPAARIFVPGRFTDRGPLLILEHRNPGLCYDIRTRQRDRAPVLLCPDHSVRLWVESALLEVGMRSATGVPEVSMAGVLCNLGDWIGSGADANHAESPRFPLRGYGIPYRAARVVTCPATLRSLSPQRGACVEVADRLGRLAIARGGPAPPGATTNNPLAPRHTYLLRSGDVLWLGLVPFAVTVPAADGGRAALLLERLDVLRAGHAGTGLVAGRSGDRRWLGKLWPVESPDRAADRAPGKTAPASFAVYPTAVRFEPKNLSRERINLEGEDILQRLIDGEWLCLDNSGNELTLVWRDLDRPGCRPSEPALRVAAGEEERRDYWRAHSGAAAPLSRILFAAAQVRLGAATDRPAFLFDPTALPFAFDWRLRRMPGPDRDLQPWPFRLWGVRFGTARLTTFHAVAPRPLPEVDLRASTARHLFQLLRHGQPDSPLASFYLAKRHLSAAGEPRSAMSEGTFCLGSEGPGNAVPLDGEAGRQHPLGSVFLPGSGTPFWWSAEPASCSRCLLRLVEMAGTVGQGGTIRLTSSGSCSPELPQARELRSGDRIPLGNDLDLRYVQRGERPWTAVTDRRTEERVYASEFYDGGGLAPLLGGPSLSGVEEAVRRFASTRTDVAPLELTIDGDLQLAAAAIVDEDSRPLGHHPEVSVAVLDSSTGEVLAAVSRSSAGMPVARRRFTAWDLGSRQTVMGANAAFTRRAAVGSAFKIVGAYALLNNGLEVRAAERQASLALEGAAGASGGRIAVVRDTDPPIPPVWRYRRCLGRHAIPAEDAGFVSATFERLFSRSCNNFFVLTGLRFAGPPATVVHAAGTLHPRPGQLLVDTSQHEIRVILPIHESLADRIRRGLAADTGAAGRPPASLYGILFALGFQPASGVARASALAPGCEVPGQLELATRQGGTIRVALHDDWFRSLSGGTPALCAGADFEYPSIPSPGRLDEQPSQERYAGKEVSVRRLQEDGDRPELQLAQLVVGQSSLGLSALGLAMLYAPAARPDGRAVSPCIFRAGCGPDRAGPQVVTTDAAHRRSLNAALGKVLAVGGTAYRRLHPAGSAGHRLGRLRADRGWGGKTGTYEIETASEGATLAAVPAGLSIVEWRDLVAFACGVLDVEPPAAARRLPELSRLVNAGRGGALGALACDAGPATLNPAGVHGYRLDGGPQQLDDLVERTRSGRHAERETFHAFVAVAPPGETGIACNPAAGLVVAVLVDDPSDSAVKIGGEIALAAERWAAANGRRCSMSSR